MNSNTCAVVIVGIVAVAIVILTKVMRASHVHVKVSSGGSIADVEIEGVSTKE